jgi:predicted RNA-binding Zn-ribbon protein involved in translation (DUF1610 family)
VRNFFERMALSMQRFMIGRNGNDSLAVAAVVIALIFVIAGSFSKLSILVYIGDAFLIYGFFRCLSKNIYKRQQESAAFDRAIAGPKRFFSLQYKRIKFRKTKKYFACSSCKTIYSAPKGKGKIRTTCPSCGKQDIHTT